ncbi:MAG: single-stranded-DNA-specific exonuclease RecJ [Candidatus Sericytochromatia bacterium]|nr:single-stranded-DNA-specific exonuclease RecJ [Candidatus Tanganyikabacteria bacterium]
MWQLRETDPQEVAALGKALGATPTLAGILAARGYRTADAARTFLEARDDLSAIRTPIASPGMRAAVARIEHALRHGERIGLYGDYDCDGVTSSAILWRYLARRRKGQVVLRLPDRFVDGYGLKPASVDEFADAGCRMILTCDNGISAYPAAERARELGLDLVVTDHHRIGPDLPFARALVHPGVDFPAWSDLCGAGVAFALVVALEGGLTPELMWLLDLVALGTVGDVVPIGGVNRPLLWAGISRIREGRCTPGTLALAEACKVDAATITARNLGFQLVPRLNAPGRLETPDAGFRLLTSNDKDEMAEIARQLEDVNQERRAVLDEQVARIMPLAEAWDLPRLPVMVLWDKDIHPGTAGLVASKLVERFGTAALLLAPGHDGLWKGSGRAPDGFHLADALAACGGLLLGHGGHANAAGCAIREADLAHLRDAINQHARQQDWTPRPTGIVTLDVELAPEDVTVALAEDLERLEPTGRGHEAPRLGWRRTRILAARTVKERHVFLTLAELPASLPLKCWNAAGKGLAAGRDLALSMDVRIRTWQGQRELDLALDRMALIEPAAQPDHDLAASVHTLWRHLEGRTGLDLFLAGPEVPLTEDGLREAYAFLKEARLIRPGTDGRHALADAQELAEALDLHTVRRRPTRTEEVPR